jgi:hypothetical protein
MGTCEPVTKVRKRARKAKRRYEPGIGKGRKCVRRRPEKWRKEDIEHRRKRGCTCQWAAGKGGKGSGRQIGENQARRRERASSLRKGLGLERRTREGRQGRERKGKGIHKDSKTTDE